MLGSIPRGWILCSGRGVGMWHDVVRLMMVSGTIHHQHLSSPSSQQAIDKPSTSHQQAMPKERLDLVVPDGKDQSVVRDGAQFYSKCRYSPIRCHRRQQQQQQQTTTTTTITTILHRSCGRQGHRGEQGQHLSLRQKVFHQVHCHLVRVL